MTRLFKLSGGIIATEGEDMKAIARRLSAWLNQVANRPAGVQRFKVTRSDAYEMDFELIVRAASWSDAQAVGNEAVVEALNAIHVTLVEDDSPGFGEHASSGSYVESLGTMLSYA